jgi:hypothetical protein
MISKGRTMESCIICAFDMVCKLEMRYLFEQDFVPKSKLPFHILKDMDSVSNNETVAQILSEWSFLIALKIQQKVFNYHDPIPRSMKYLK